MAFPELVGHQPELVALLLTGVQLLRQDQERFGLTLQLLLANHQLRGVFFFFFKREEEDTKTQRRDARS